MFWTYHLPIFSPSKWHWIYHEIWHSECHITPKILSKKGSNGIVIVVMSHDSISNHCQSYCLCNRLFGWKYESCALLTLWGNPSVTVGFFHRGPVMQNLFPCHYDFKWNYALWHPVKMPQHLTTCLHLPMWINQEWINSLWPSDTIWHHKIQSTLVQFMAWCLMAPSHYLNQCWLIINEVLWHPPKGDFARNAKNIFPWCEVEN